MASQFPSLILNTAFMQRTIMPIMWVHKQAKDINGCDSNRPRRSSLSSCGFTETPHFSKREMAVYAPPPAFDEAQREDCMLYIFIGGMGGVGKNKAQVSFQDTDVLEQPFFDGQFDLVWSMESGEYVPNKTKFVNEMELVKEISLQFYLFFKEHGQLQNLNVTTIEGCNRMGI